MKRETRSLKDLCALYDLSLNPACIYVALVKSGVMRDVYYLSTTGSGDNKCFREISPDFMHFGINRKTMHEFRTEPRFYVDQFPALVELAVNQIKSESDRLKII